MLLNKKINLILLMIILNSFVFANTGYKHQPLTKGDYDWLNENRNIKIAYNPDMAPFTFTGKNYKLSGISSD